MYKELSPAPPPEVILPRLGPTVQEKVFVEDRTFLIQRPAHSDKLLNDPAVESAFNLDEYMPYWADLWPAARMLAKVLLREPLPAGATALELGCGLGLSGLVALSRGLRVIFSDYDRCALHFAAANARLNGFHDFETMAVDWRHPPDDLRLPVILGSDLIYELRNVAPLVSFIKTVLVPDGVCLLTDQDRIPAQALRDTLAAEGLHYTTQLVRAGEPGGRRLKGTLYRIRHRAPLATQLASP
jgi:predicted nicotinamide N-methyase